MSPRHASLVPAPARRLVEESACGLTPNQRVLSLPMALRHTVPVVDQTEAKTMRTRLATSIAGRWRRFWLTGGVLGAWALLLLPVALAAPAQEPGPVAVVQLLICGIILGIGRQGLDVLLLRLFAAASGLLVGSVVGQWKIAHVSVCASPLDCLQSLLVGLFGFGMLGTVFLALVSIPATVVWNRGVASLRPEIHWPVPTKWWHWLVLLLGIAAVVFVSGLILGVPWPA
jgi:hypothetical protein